MNTIRIGNDIFVVWKVFSRNGMNFSLDNQDIRVWLSSGPFKMEITDFTTSIRGEVAFKIDASSITRLGIYTLKMCILDKDAKTADATFDVTHVFQIVSTNYKDTNNPVLDGNVEIEPCSVLNNVITSTLEGASAYEIAVEHGYRGTEQEWLNSLKGETGARGPRGFQGIQGEKGERGLQGLKGEKGDQGNSGYTGAAGELNVVNNLTDGGAAAALSAEMGQKIGYREKNAAKVLYSSSPVNFDNTAKKVYLPWFGFSNPKAASGRTEIQATEVAYSFAATTTSAYMLYYNIDTETYSFVATTASVTEKDIPIAAIQVAGDTSLGTGRVVSVRWCVAKDARVDGVSEMTRLASVEREASYLNFGEKTFTPDFAIVGTIYNGSINRSVSDYLYNPTFVQVQPGSTIKCFHIPGVTLRITEYDEDYVYVVSSGAYSELSDYTLSEETRYVRMSAEYSGYSAEDPITANDFQTGDFGFAYETCEELDRLNAPIYSFYEAPWWVDDAQWKKSNYNYGAIIIPASGAKKLTMTAGTDVNARVAFANTYDPATLNENDPIDGIGNQGCAPGETRTLDIPATCEYIVLSCRYTWNADPEYDADAKPNALPVSLIIDGKEYMKAIEEAVSSTAEKVQSVSGIPDGKAFNIIGRNITKDTAVRATGTKVNTSYHTDPIKPLAFIHVSDIHTKGNNYKCFQNCLEFLQHYSVLQFAIVTGDLVWDNFADAMTWYDLALQQTTKPVLNVIGNHDAGQQSITTPSLDKVSSDIQCYGKFIAPYVSGWGVTQPADAETYGKSYYFKDFTDEKIRLIVLNEYETDYDVDPENPDKLLYSREYRAMHQAQVDWLISTLGSTPDDYGVIVAYHQPDDYIIDDGNEFVSFDLAGRQLASIYSETRNWLPRILDAFANKSSLNFSFAQTGAVVGTIDVECDFSQNQAEFICILNGHTHRDIVGRLSAFPGLLVLCVGADNLLYTSNFCPRAEGTPSEDLFNVVNIDRNRGTIKIIRIGSDASITGQKRDQLLINYREQ